MSHHVFVNLDKREYIEMSDKHYNIIFMLTSGKNVMEYGDPVLSFQSKDFDCLGRWYGDYVIQPSIAGSDRMLADEPFYHLYQFPDGFDIRHTISTLYQVIKKSCQFKNLSGLIAQYVDYSRLFNLFIFDKVTASPKTLDDDLDNLLARVAELHFSNNDVEVTKQLYNNRNLFIHNNMLYVWLYNSVAISFVYYLYAGIYSIPIIKETEWKKSIICNVNIGSNIKHYLRSNLNKPVYDA